jgi:uncharacterized delta-60 repeat protein
LDNSFGAGGIVVASVVGKQSVARSLGIQQDGKIVVAGGSYTSGDSDYSNEELIVRRYNPNGSSDSSFGVEGKVSLSVNIGAQATSLAVQPDGKIVVGGFVSSGSNIYDFLVVRLNLDGSLDQGFGSEGKVITSIIPPPDHIPVSGYWGSRVYRLLLQPDGRIVVAGNIYEGWRGAPGPDGSLPTGYALARYNADGSLDSGFGSNGISLTRPDRISTVEAVAIQLDGKLVVGGGSSGGGRYSPFLVRVNTNGTPDSSLSSSALVAEAPTGVMTSLAVQNDGKIVGIVDCNVLCRFNSNGTTDTSFGHDGIITSLDWYRARGQLAILSNGKIIVAGSTINSTVRNLSGYRPTELALERYNSNGSYDNTFASSGATDGLYGNDSKVFSITLQQDGKLVIAGSSKNNSFQDAFTVARCIP